MKKLKVFFALLMSLALMFSFCAVASAEGEPAWSLSDDGNTLTCLDNYYVRFKTAQFGVDVDQVIYKTDEFVIYSVRGDSRGDLVWVIDRCGRWQAELFCLVDAKDEVSQKLLNFEPGNRFVSTGGWGYPITYDLGEGAIEALRAADGERVDYLELTENYSWTHEVAVYDSEGLFRTEVGYICEDDDGNRYYFDYTTVEGTQFNYGGSPMATFGSTAKLVLLTSEQFEALDLGADEEYIARSKEYDANFFRYDENIIVDDKTSADVIALVMSALLFGLLPLAAVVIGIIGTIRSRRYRTCFIVMAALGLVIIAAYATVMVMLL